jgi:hypothetical protein
MLLLVVTLPVNYAAQAFHLHFARLVILAPTK